MLPPPEIGGISESTCASGLKPQSASGPADAHLLALAGGEVRDEAHRAVEYHGEVDRVFVVGDLDDVHQARVGAGGKLRQRLRRAAGGQENKQDEGVARALSA
jgi:hypothetical protein